MSICNSEIIENLPYFMNTNELNNESHEIIVDCDYILYFRNKHAVQLKKDRRSCRNVFIHNHYFIRIVIHQRVNYAVLRIGLTLRKYTMCSKSM